MYKLAFLLVALVPNLLCADNIVVSVSPPATRVGETVLKNGGTAVDAAVAVGFALAVTWPEAGNIGGGGFMLVRPTDGKPTVFDYRETAPAAASMDLFVKHGRKPHLTVGVPGSVAGLAAAHAKYGKLPWKDLVSPAIKLAEEGFAIDDALAGSLNGVLRRGKDTAELQRIFGKKDKWAVGEKLVQSDLAKTLRLIAAKGPSGFYQGETAQRIIDEMKRGGGIITHEDLQQYTAKEREPKHGTYRGYDVYGTPPPSSGGICLIEMLNILETFDVKAHPRFSAETLHLLAETMRRAYLDRARSLGDQDFVKIPVHLTSKDHARKLAASIDLKKATPSDSLAPEIVLNEEKKSTTHYSILDAKGMAVSTTTTLEDSFGSKLVVPGAGFLLNNEMTDFNPRPGITTREGIIGTLPNQIAPGKRMLSSMSPTIITKDGKTILITGSPGGRTIINTVLNVVVNVLDYEMPLRDAVAAPRMHQQWMPDRIQLEATLYVKHPEVVKLLEKLGHRVMKVRAQGDAHSIAWNAKAKKYEGVVDPRRVGR
jgi:gamma-glutamyltranspeptidase/glutathione hydrolase